MSKLLTSPLLIVLVLLWLTAIWCLVSQIKRNCGCLKQCILGMFPLLVLTLLCTTNVRDLLYQGLKVESESVSVCPIDVVVVLGGGYYSSHGHGDELSEESAVRVIKGVKIFKQCNAKLLVLSGREKGETKERLGELMRDLAMYMGIPYERIFLETDSTNTREHPICLAASGKIDSHERVAVVTSPWHLKRAMREFCRFIPEVVAVAAFDFPSTYHFSIYGWLPMSSALHDTTTIGSEYIGMLWYEMLNRYPQYVGSISCF